MPTSIAERLLQIKKRVAEAESRFQRQLNSIQVIAMSKSQSLHSIKEAIMAGQRAFGENYVQESLAKIEQLKDFTIAWHFVGKIQSNKTKVIAENFTWVHSLSEIKIAERLNKYRKANQLPLNVCIQVNLDKEPSKSGIYLEDTLPFIQSLEKFPQLKLRGLMAIPKVKNNFSDQRQSFKRLRTTLEKLQQLGFKLDTLSMGMSDDFEAAIAEGATFVRIGTAIFGKRK